MNKTLKAFLMGYILFKVNNKKFFRYNTALKEQETTIGNVDFIGWNVWRFLFTGRGWRGFFEKIFNPKIQNVE